MYVCMYVEGITQTHNRLTDGAQTEQCRFKLQEKSDIEQCRQLWTS